MELLCLPMLSRAIQKLNRLIKSNWKWDAIKTFIIVVLMCNIVYCVFPVSCIWLRADDSLVDRSHLATHFAVMTPTSERNLIRVNLGNGLLLTALCYTHHLKYFFDTYSTHASNRFIRLTVYFPPLKKTFRNIHFILGHKMLQCCAKYNNY